MLMKFNKVCCWNELLTRRYGYRPHAGVPVATQGDRRADRVLEPVSGWVPYAMAFNRQPRVSETAAP